MAGRPKRIRSINSYIAHIDNNTASGPMKCGLTSSIGNTHYYSHFYQTRGTTKTNQFKKSYNNMVFLNINSAQTPVSEGFTPSTYVNYTNNFSYNIANQN